MSEEERVINKLVADNKALRDLVDWQAAENKRLREALREIAQSQPSDSEQAFKFKMLARAALEEGK